MTPGIDIDWQATGGLAGALTAIGTALWALWERKERSRSEARAEVAQNDAEAGLYRMLNDRINAMQAEMKELRAELGDYRRRNNRLEVHIFRLERLMREKGIEPPPFEEAP